MQQAEISETILEVEPGFNTFGLKEPDSVQSLITIPSLDIFDERTRAVLQKKSSFKLKLGGGFDQSSSVRGMAFGPCKGLASVEQLRFLMEHGLTSILMKRVHPTLAENALSVGIKIEIIK